MIGALVMVIVLVVVIPVSVIMTGVIVAGTLGWSLKDGAESDHEGSELVELNR